MYRSGLTPHRIAELCDVPEGRINRALGWSKRRDPSLAVEHVDHLPPDDRETPSQISDQWKARYAELLLFTTATGRMPFTKVPDPVEASLGRWLARQRYALVKGRLDRNRQLLLDASGSWRQSTRAQRDMTRWKETLNESARHMRTSNRWPSFRNHADETERRLGTWLHAQRQSALTGTLTDKQLADMNAVAPGWNTWRTTK